MLADVLLYVDVTGLLWTLIILCTAYWFWRRQHSQHGYPPGPPVIPVFGNLVQVAFSGTVQKFMQKYKNIYGSAFTVEFAGRKRVIISGYENIHNLLVKNADWTSNRSQLSFVFNDDEVDILPPGLLWAPFPHWKTLRSFTLNVLRDEGMGKQDLEPSIISEVERYCEKFIEPHLGTPICMSDSLPKATNNIISELVFGGRVDYEDKLAHQLVDGLTQAIKLSQTAFITKTIPFIKYINATGISKILEVRNFVNEEMNKRLQEHKNSLDLLHPKDIFDEFLIHRLKLQNGSDCFSDENAVGMAVQMYAAGTETTSTALSWALLYSCFYPDVIARVQEEIDNVIGHDRMAKYSDRNQMPYTDAVLLETLRLANIAPTALPHQLEKEMNIDGVVIPANTELMINMASVLHDEEVFENPEEFHPERYLTGDIKLKKQRTIPFSLGRRVCLGESLARMEFFLFYVTFLQKYDISFPENKKPSLAPDSSVIQSAKPYSLVLRKRDY